jgi:hypothetical protein
MASHERISAVDAAWLHMDSTHNELVITAMLGLDGKLDDSEVDAALRRLLMHKRFRQRVAEPHRPLAFARWEDVHSFDGHELVHRVSLESPTVSAFADLLSDAMSVPLDHNKPLWEVRIVDGAVPTVASGSVVIARVHHALADGGALVRTLLDVATSGAHAPPPSGAFHSRFGFGDLARRAAEQALTLSKLALLPPDPPTPLRGVQSLKKRAAWSRSFPLRALAEVAERLGATVDDVLIASSTAALAAYIKRRGDAHEGLEIHGVVPLFMGGERVASNHLGLVFLALPLGASSPENRVRAVTRRMGALQASPEAADTFALLAASGLASAAIERVLVDLFSRKGSVMIASVPGPPRRIALSRHAVESLAVWAPVAGQVAVGLSMITYAGEVRVGVSSDAGLVPDPDAIVMELERDLVRLMRTRALGYAPGP